MVLGGLTPANKLDGARCLRRFSTQAAIYAVGGGLLEVLVSPIVEHLPTPAGQKASGMALLNSCYCWGQVAVVVGTTIVLGLLGPGLFALLMGIGRFAYGMWGPASTCGACCCSQVWGCGLAEASSGAQSGLAQMLPDDGGYGLRTALLLCAVIPTIFAVVVWRFGKVRHTSAVPAGARPKP